MTEYVEYIDRYTVKPAKLPLKEIYEEDGEMRQRLIFNPTEADYNRLGLYALVEEPYPTDAEHVYRKCYEKDGLTVHQGWEQGEKIEVETVPEEPTISFVRAVAKTDMNSFAKLRVAANDTLNAIEGGGSIDR